MIYSASLSTVSLTSEWSCHTVWENGKYVYKIVEQPTTAYASALFPVSLPSNASVGRVWLTMDVSSPVSGASWRGANGQWIPYGGTVELNASDISSDTTEYSVSFSFRANGMIVENYARQYSTLYLYNPTLHVEYSGESAEEDDAISPDTTHTSDNDPNDGRGGSLPRLLSPSMVEVSRLETDSTSLELNLYPLSTARMHIIPGQQEVKIRDFVELFAPSGSVGVYRVSDVETTYGLQGGQDVFLEHAFSTLLDSIAIEMQAMSAPVATIVATLLESQNVKHWVMGDCDVPTEYELVYEYTYDSLLKTVLRLFNMLPEGYALEFNTRRYPFVLHIRALPTEDFCEVRLNRNLSSARVKVEDSGLCTRVYPFGAGEGAERISLTSLTGQQYLESDTVESWGVVSKTFTEEDIYDALTLKDVAERYLEKHKNPAVSVEMDAFDLYSATEMPFDRFRMGRICRMPLPKYGTIMRERVVSVSYPNVYGTPERVVVTLANKIRNVSDELADLMREATGGKLIGGTVEEAKTEYNNDSVTQSSSLVHYFDITGYGNTLTVRAKFTPAGGCLLLVDGETEVPAGEAESGSVDILRYLKSDENGVPIVGEHNVQYFALGAGTISVHSEVTVKTIEKR